MANKTINQLQLIAGVTDGINIPGDNGTQTYRLTAAQIKAYVLANGNVPLAALNTSIFNGLTQVTAAQDDFFPLVDTSDSNLTKKALVSDLKGKTVVSATTTHSAAIGTYIICSGTSFSATLPSAASNDGKEITLFHAGTSGTNRYTVGRTSSQTINGINADYELFHYGQYVTFMAVSGNWIITDHHRITGIYGYANGGGVNTTTDVNFTETEDYPSLMASGVVTITGHYAGLWCVSVSMGTTSGTPGPRIMVNGSTFQEGPSAGGQSGATTRIVRLASADTVSCRPSSNLTLNSSNVATTFSMFKIGA